MLVGFKIFLKTFNIVPCMKNVVALSFWYFVTNSKTILVSNPKERIFKLVKIPESKHELEKFYFEN